MNGKRRKCSRDRVMRPERQSRVLRRLRSVSGETLIEVLVALMIAVPAMGMIAGAIVTSANINRRMEKETGQLQKFLPAMDAGGSKASGEMQVSGASLSESGANGSYSINLYNDDGSDYFYYFTE